MINKIRLQNFRGFDDHVVPFLPTTIVVGQNNAGKSTIVEALRLISLAIAYAKSRSYVPRRWTISRHARTAKTLAPTLLSLEINTDSVFHRYGDPPSIITAFFASGARIEIYIHRNEIIADFSARSQDDLAYVSILPQVAPVAREERVLNADYVRSALSSFLAPLHFRNQIHLLAEHFESFRRIAEETWHHLRVAAPEVIVESIGKLRLSLMITDGDFTAEVAWMGHGLQMWLQTMWFLARVSGHETVILDEPDVYMHADLQRRLIRFLKSRHKQIIVATHSAEIMAEVEADEILVVRKEEPQSRFAPSLPAAQEVLHSLGSVHNLQLARLVTARRYVFVEGDDIAVLKRFQDTIFPNSTIPLDTISIPIAGWGGWNYAVGTAQFLSKTAGASLTRYCILDSDYHTSAEISDRLKDAAQRNIQLHVWKKKEIENYLLVPSAICRFIQSKRPRRRPTEKEIVEKIDSIAKSLRTVVRDAIGTEIQNQNRKLTFSAASREAEERINPAWKSRASRWGIISGKEAFAQLSGWSKATFNVSFSTVNIAREILGEELDPEIQNLLTCIESGQTLADAM
jgi:predicted ATPase